ncbi:putative nicotinate-nucleotide adenylyltransferase [Labrys miyagiensis]
MLAPLPSPADARRLPTFSPGMTIGLFGGSFNPPHEGHRHASLVALTRLGLDQVWWLVTPGNPLKDNQALPSLEMRVAAARSLADHPRIAVTGIEAAIHTRYTYDTIAWLQRRCPGVTFVWIMGADNLAGFHRWQHWRGIASRVAIAVVARPGATTKGPLAKAARVLSRFRLQEYEARNLKYRQPPAWVFLHAPLDSNSSTALRARGHGLPLGKN